MKLFGNFSPHAIVTRSLSNSFGASTGTGASVMAAKSIVGTTTHRSF